LRNWKKDIGAIIKEGEIDEKILGSYLKLTTRLKAKEKLKEMLNDPAIDIRYYAGEALAKLS